LFVFGVSHIGKVGGRKNKERKENKKQNKRIKIKNERQ